MSNAWESAAAAADTDTDDAAAADEHQSGGTVPQGLRCRVWGNRFRVDGSVLGLGFDNLEVGASNTNLQTGAKVAV